MNIMQILSVGSIGYLLKTLLLTKNTSLVDKRNLHSFSKANSIVSVCMHIFTQIPESTPSHPPLLFTEKQVSQTDSKPVVKIEIIAYVDSIPFVHFPKNLVVIEDSFLQFDNLHHQDS